MTTTSKATAPRRIVLEKTYPIDEPDAAWKGEEWASPLWQYLAANIPFSVSVSGLKGIEDEFSRLLHERFINYVYSRLVVAGCFVLKGQDLTAEHPEKLEAAVEGVLDVQSELRDRIVWYLQRICPRILNGSASPSKGQRKVIRAFAVKNGHRCYMCGRFLHYERDRPFGHDDAEGIEHNRKKRAFEIEHVWSQARGGSRDRTNLAASCNECNNLKKHLLSFADCAIEQIMTLATDPKNISGDMPAASRQALIWRQGGRCAACERKLHDIDNESLYLVKKERDEPLHFFNMQAVCAYCNTERNLEGVDLRARV